MFGKPMFLAALGPPPSDTFASPFRPLSSLGEKCPLKPELLPFLRLKLGKFCV